MIEKLYDIDEISELFKISPSTLYKWTMKKEIPFIKLGKHLRFEESKVAQWLNDRRYR